MIGYDKELNNKIGEYQKSLLNVGIKFGSMRYTIKTIEYSFKILGDKIKVNWGYELFTMGWARTIQEFICFYYVKLKNLIHN